MPRSARLEGYSRRNRFSERGSFGPILRSPRKLRGRYAIIHVAPVQDGVSRLGIALTRRLVPSAVHRNLVKRLVRESFRRHCAAKRGVDCVLTLRERFDPSHAAPLAAEVRALLDRLCAGDKA
jgi:ribonuclease P protein component